MLTLTLLLIHNPCASQVDHTAFCFLTAWSTIRVTGSFTFFLTLFAATDAAPVSTIAYLSHWVRNAGN